MKSLLRPDVRLAYTDCGETTSLPPIVFVHGWGCDHSIFAQQAETFSTSTRVVSIDLRGHGQSDAPDQDFTIRGFADDLAWTCESLQLNRPVIVGHSMGGNIALEAAAQYPETFGAIIMIDSVLFPPPQLAEGAKALFQALASPQWLEAYHAGVRGLCLPTDDPAVIDPVLASLPRASQQVLLSSLIDLVQKHDASAAARGCHIPVAYIGASNPMGDTVAFKKLTPQLITAQTLGSGHFSLNVVPEQIASMIQRFLAITKLGGQ